MICAQCQATNDHGSLFCANCGTSLTHTAAGTGRPGSPQQSTIMADPGPGGPGAAGGYYPAGAPADPYGQAAQPGQYRPGASGAPSNPYGPAGPADPYQVGRPQGQPTAWDVRAPAQAFSLDLRRLSRVDQTVGGASLVLLISLFLPWFGFSGFDGAFSVSGTSTHGYLIIVVILALLMVAYLVMRAGWDKFPVNLPIAHAPLLLIGTGAQLLLVLIGFLAKPSGLSWEIGAYLGLIAAITAAGPVIVPAIRSWQASR